tara:strand:+ start:494 stop:994 length:501 start_codon:yes stop_codon:yes gene_type:complete
LLLAYDDILKFNNWANEYNYIIQVFRSIQDSFLGGTESDFSNEASWLDLFKKYDADGDGLLNKAELRLLIRNTPSFKKATDAETDFIYRLIASSGQGGQGRQLTPRVWLDWSKGLRGKREASLLYLSQLLDIKGMPVATADDISTKAYAEGEFERKLRQREGSSTK